MPIEHLEEGKNFDSARERGRRFERLVVAIRSLYANLTWSTISLDLKGDVYFMKFQVLNQTIFLSSWCASSREPSYLDTAL